MKFIMKSTMFAVATAASSSFFPQQYSFNQPAGFTQSATWSTSQTVAASPSQPVWEPYAVPAPVAQPVAAPYPSVRTAAQPAQPAVETWEETLARLTAQWTAEAAAQSFSQPVTTGSVLPGQADAFVQPSAQPSQPVDAFPASQPVDAFVQTSVQQPSAQPVETLVQPSVQPVGAVDAFVQPEADQFAHLFGDSSAEPFKQDTVRKYNIMISATDIAQLNSDYAAEEYVPCSITTAYGTDFASTFEGCGCRYKGAVGSLLACIDPDTGKLNGKCRKFSIKVDANEFRNDKQKIEGNKKLMFHGMSVDKSLVSERVAYNAMQELGLPSPRATHVEVFVNGKFDGVYTVVEEVEKVLSKRYFSEDYNSGKGAIYKDVWFEDYDMTPEYLDDARKSGGKEDEFMQEVKAIVPYIGDCATLERYFDLDSIAAVTAFNNLVGLFDDWRMKHNFFWYVREDGRGKKLVMIPWDYDRLNDDFNAPGGKRRAHAQKWTDKPNPFECADIASHASVKGLTGRESGAKKVWVERVQANLPKDSKKPIECYHLTQMFAQCLDVDSKVAQFKAQLPAATLASRMDEYAAQIAPSVAKDTSITTQEWKAGISALKTYLATSANLATSPKGRASSASVVSPAVNSVRSSFSSFGQQSKFARRSSVASASRSTGASPSGTFSRLRSVSNF